jgi:hypothetical protein
MVMEDNDDNDNASEESPLYSVENSDTAVDMDALWVTIQMYRPRKISAATAVVHDSGTDLRLPEDEGAQKLP